jgi:putative Ca2+/H+ antiporter (TMEM165/GDT1 family)
MVGMAAAFMAKMGVAVVVGEAISRLPTILVASITAISFLGVAYVLWRKSDTPKKSEKTHTTSRAAMLSFAAIFFSEWGDVGQVTAATLAARYRLPFIVWLGAFCAMITKGTLATFLGAGIRRWITQHVSPKVVRYAAVALLLFLGVLTVLEIVIERR